MLVIIKVLLRNNVDPMASAVATSAAMSAPAASGPEVGMPGYACSSAAFASTAEGSSQCARSKSSSRT